MRASILFPIVLLFVTACATQDAPSALPSGPLSFVDMNGQEHSLAGFQQAGKQTVLVFWQPWCVPCRREAPALVAASRAHADDLAFVGIVSGPDDVVDDAVVAEAAQTMGLPYPQVRDKDGSIAARFEVYSTPVILVLEGDQLRYRGNHAPEDWSAWK